MNDLGRRILRAEEVHRRLRAVQPAPQNLDEKAELLREIIPVLEEIGGAVAASEGARRKELRQVLLALRTDAEYFAGAQAEAEGYRHAEDVWDGYARLRAACSD